MYEDKRACGWVERYLLEERTALVVHAEQWTLFLTDYGTAFTLEALRGNAGDVVLLGNEPNAELVSRCEVMETRVWKNSADGAGAMAETLAG